MCFAEQCASCHWRRRSRRFSPVHSQVLQDVLHRLDHAFAAFFRRVKRARARIPQVQRRWLVRLSCIGNTATARSSTATASCSPRSAASSSARIARLRASRRPARSSARRTAGSHTSPAKSSRSHCRRRGNGRRNLGIESFATLSTGEQIANLRHYRTAERRLKTKRNAVSRAGRRGSNGRRKARQLLAKAHLEGGANPPRFLPQGCSDLVTRFDHIVVEEPEHPGDGEEPSLLAKSISDAGWGTFVTILSEEG